jgi:hypothetical protein
MRRHCDRCGAEAGVTLRALGEQLPAKRPRIDLCRRCWAALDRWLCPVGPPVRPPDDDDQGDDDGPETDAVD